MKKTVTKIALPKPAAPETEEKVMGESLMGDELALLKKKYGTIFAITVGEGEDERTCYLRQPTRQEFGYAVSSAQNNPLSLSERLMESCFVGGDTCIRDDDAYFLSAVGQVASIVEFKKAQIAKY